MRILEYGDKSKDKMILVHGFQCPVEIWNPYIEHYKDDFHIIVPVMSGHNVEDKSDFISFDEDAREIENFIISNYGNEIYAVFGISMGGVLSATLWQNGRLHFKKVIFDGSPLVSLNNIMRICMTKFYMSVTHKSQKRDEKTLRQATKGIMPECHMEAFLKVLDNMSDTTIRNSINGIAGFKLKDDIDVSNTNIYFFHGTKINEMMAKKSAKYLKKIYSKTVIKAFKGKFHCEDTLFNPKKMILELDTFFPEIFLTTKNHCDTII